MKFHYAILNGSIIIALYFSLTESQVGDTYVPIELIYSGQKVFKNLHLHTAL